MERLTPTQKLFNAIVVVGVASALGCSSGGSPGSDASTDGNEVADNNVQDVKSNDVMMESGPGKDAGSDADAFNGWLATC
jgi:hypothetical protein